jgi:hypothetical protein
MPAAATNSADANAARPQAVAYKLPGVKLFASGTYRGKEWTPEFIRQMERNAKALGPGGLKLLVPPAAPGHEDDDGWQEFVGEVSAPGPRVRTDEPAAGWVDPATVKAVPDPEHKGHLILTGDVVNVPAEMAEKIRSGEYRFGSSEIYDDFLDDFGNAHGKTLRKFSFLGGEVPQVKRLGPLPRPVPQTSLKVFSERGDGRRRFIRVRSERRGQSIHHYAETVSMDRQQMMTAVMAAMPGLSQATLDGMSDEQIADLVKNLPAPAADPTATPAPAPVATMADDETASGGDSGSADSGAPSRDDMIAELVDMGEDQAELEGMADDELAALYEELTSGGEGGEGAGGEGVSTMGDPATMTREDMIAELVAEGQDPAALQAMSDDDLKNLYAQLTGGATAAAAQPPAQPAATMGDRKNCMSDRTGRTKPQTQPNRRGKTMPATAHSEGRRFLANAKRLNEEVEGELKRLRASNAASKRRDAETFCDTLVAQGRITRAQVATLALPALLPLDDTRAVHQFTENGQTRSLSAYEKKKRELAQMSVVVRFGERLPAGHPDNKQARAAEVNKVERFCEIQGEQLKKHGSDPKKLVETAKKMAESDPNFTAAKLIGESAAAMVG